MRKVNNINICMNTADYTKIKDSAYLSYSQFKPIRCPQLGSKVVFNDKGFWHIIYRAKDKKRDESSQILRFRLLKKVKELLSITTTIQEYESVTRELTVKDHGKKVVKLVTLQFFGYIAIIDNWKFKAIIRKDGNGQPYFWSVIPNWITNKKRDQRYQNYVGNLEED
jgi:hypothetical protein